MPIGLTHGSARCNRRAVIAVAALLLFVQSFAIAHYHQDDPRWGITGATRLADTDALCAVCAFYFHFSTKAAPTATVPGAALAEYRIAADAPANLAKTLVSQPSSRAPPVSA